MLVGVFSPNTVYIVACNEFAGRVQNGMLR